MYQLSHYSSTSAEWLNGLSRRNNLQTELTRLQNLVASQADALERVKVENSQLKLQLNDTQHKVSTGRKILLTMIG